MVLQTNLSLAGPFLEEEAMFPLGTSEPSKIDCNHFL